jgi:cysteine desulfuration protein SufE
MSLADKRASLLDDLLALPPGEERFAYLLAAARRFPPLALELCTDQHRVPGCVSQLWLVPELRAGRCHFGMEGDALIAKGIAAVVCNFYEGETPAEVAATEPDFLQATGLAQALSPNRSTGLASLRGLIRDFALRQLPAA